MSTIRGQFYNPSHNSHRWDIVLLGAYIYSPSLLYAGLHSVAKVVSWALYSREQYKFSV